MALYIVHLEIYNIPVEVFTLGSDISHAIPNLPLPLFTSGLFLSCAHYDCVILLSPTRKHCLLKKKFLKGKWPERIGEKRKREERENFSREVLGKLNFFSAARAVMHGPSRKSLRAFPTVDNQETKSPHSRCPYCQGGVIDC